MGQVRTKVAVASLVAGVAWLGSPGILVPEGATLSYPAADVPSESRLRADLVDACNRRWGVLRPLFRPPDIVTVQARQTDGTLRSAVVSCDDGSVVRRLANHSPS